MAEDKPDIIAWLEKHHPQPVSPEARGPLRLYGYQRAMVGAMSDPGVRVVILSRAGTPTFRPWGPSMAEATFAAFMAHHLEHMRTLADQPYEVVTEDFRRGQSLQVKFLIAERERHQREMDAWCAEFERGYLASTWRAMVDVVVDAEADKIARPAIGKPLSRRARRRNRGRVRAARIALGRTWHQPVQWEWPAPGGFHV